MKKIIIIILIILGIGSAGLIGGYFIKQNKLPINLSENAVTNQGGDGASDQIDIEQSQNKMITDDFGDQY